MIHSNQIRTRKNKELQVISQNNKVFINEVLLCKDYQNYFNPVFLFEGDNQNFIKNLRLYSNYQELEDLFSPALKRNIKKSKEAFVKVRELDETEIYQFYQILAKTAKRRGFSIQEKDFFKKLKTNFGSAAKFMMAYLQCKAYENSLNEQIVDFSKRIAELKQKSDSKKRNVAIKNAKQKLDSYQKRLSDFHAYQVKTDILPLSSYLFIYYGNQLLSYFGGTIETDQSKNGIGNFNYKKQFGGELCQYWGSYTKPLI